MYYLITAVLAVLSSSVFAQLDPSQGGGSATVPEPGIAGLLVAGAVGIYLIKRKKK